MNDATLQRRIEHLEKALKLAGLNYTPRPVREQLSEKERVQLAGQLAKLQAERDAVISEILTRSAKVEKRIANAIEALHAIGAERYAVSVELDNAVHRFTLAERPLETALREGAGPIFDVVAERFAAERLTILREMDAPEPPASATKSVAEVLFGDEERGRAARKRREALTERLEALNSLAGDASKWPLVPKTDKEIESMLEAGLRALPIASDRKAAA